MYDVIIIGGGPSGMMAGIAALKNNKKVLLIDKNKGLGMKLKLTGGGRCNLTNLKDNKELVKILHNGKYMHSSLNNFSSEDIYNFFTNLGVKLKVEDNNRVFSFDNSALTILNALINKLNTEILYNTKVLDIKPGKIKLVSTNNGVFKAKNVIIATGGKSYQNTGSTGDGYLFAKSLGHTITPLAPAETYVVIKDKVPLMGLTTVVSITYKDIVSEGSLLFTHIGLTGPSIFNLSEFIYRDLLDKKKARIEVDFIPNMSNKELLDSLNKEESKNLLKTWLRKLVQQKLADFILEELGDIKIASISSKNKDIVINKIKGYVFDITKTGSLEESIVTGGGISVNEIDTKTMESKLHKGIYFVGEVLDIHGPVGGYNLTIAFSTGYTAGINIE